LWPFVGAVGTGAVLLVLLVFMVSIFFVYYFWLIWISFEMIRVLVYSWFLWMVSGIWIVASFVWNFFWWFYLYDGCLQFDWRFVCEF
jgi:hypothetical protein